MSAKADKTGSCSFCGQTKIIQVPEEWEQGQINEAVTCECEKVLRLNGRRTKRQPTKNSGLGGQYCKELMMILKPQ